METWVKLSTLYVINGKDDEPRWFSIGSNIDTKLILDAPTFEEAVALFIETIQESHEITGCRTRFSKPINKRDSAYFEIDGREYDFRFWIGKSFKNAQL